MNTLDGAIRINAVMPLAFALFAALCGLFYALKTNRRVRFLFDKISATMPVIGPLTAKMAAAGLLRGSGLFLSAGLPFERAMDDAKGLIGNRWLAERYAAMSRRVRQGVETDKALSDDAFPPLLGETLSLAMTEDCDDDSVAEMFRRAAVLLEETADERLSVIERVFEVVVVVLAGLMLGAVALSVALPLINLLK